MKRMRLLPSSLLVLALLLWLPSGSLAQVQAAQVGCTCDEQDKIDMEDRLKMIENAFKAIDWLIKQWEGEEKTRGEEVKLDDTIRGSLRTTINREMSRDHNSAANIAKAVTEDFRCQIKSVEGPACLKAGLTQHEKHHQDLCKKELPGYRYRQRVVDYLKEERHGYEIEKQFYEKELTRLKNSCPKQDRSTQESLQAQKERMERAEYRVNLLGNALDQMGP